MEFYEGTTESVRFSEAEFGLKFNDTETWKRLWAKSVCRSNPGGQNPATLVSFEVRMLGLELFAMYPPTPPNPRVDVPARDEQMNVHMRTTPYSSIQ